jgi:Zn-dependent alcohol dehydrogenase
MQITAAVARAKNAPLSLEEVSLAEPRADEVLVRLVAAGICHTDISMRDHIIYPVPHPVVLGHEGAGIVERVGAGVTRLAAGDPVILTSASCGHCPSCDSGLPIYCYEFNDRNFTGTRIDGVEPAVERRRDHSLLSGTILVRDARRDPRAKRRQSAEKGAARDAGATRLRHHDRRRRRHQFAGRRHR